MMLYSLHQDERKEKTEEEEEKEEVEEEKKEEEQKEEEWHVRVVVVTVGPVKASGVHQGAASTPFPFLLYANTPPPRSDNGPALNRL